MVLSFHMMSDIYTAYDPDLSCALVICIVAIRCKLLYVMMHVRTNPCLHPHHV